MRSRIPVSRLTTASGTHGLHLSVAAGFLSRLRGLMLAPTLDYDAGLILTNCSCIHSCFMRQEIDVLRLVVERTRSVNTAAAGGNAYLMTLAN